MIVFTICARNYLSYAISLGESIKETNPNLKFVICLADQEYEGDLDFETLSVDKVVSTEVLNNLQNKYDITEFATAIKPHFFEHFLLTYDKVIYLDPDILVFNSLNELSSYLDNYSIIVTPHFCTPQPDELSPNDLSMLRTGVYNLGFIAISNTEDSMSFVLWWKRKLLDYCYANLNIGLFTDQLWVVYVTCFVNNVLVLKHLGYNVANWNLHERMISRVSGKYIVNNQLPLVFFHFSNFSISNPSIFASYNNRYNAFNRPDVAPLFELFASSVSREKLKHFKDIKPEYSFVRSRSGIKMKLNKLITKTLFYLK